MSTYVIPVAAERASDAVPVGSEAGVARYFLEEDEPPLQYRLGWFLATERVLNLLTAGWVERAYLGLVYRRLESGMYSGFCWGDEKFVEKYFR